MRKVVDVGNESKLSGTRVSNPVDSGTVVGAAVRSRVPPPMRPMGAIEAWTALREMQRTDTRVLVTWLGDSDRIPNTSAGYVTHLEASYVHVHAADGAKVQVVRLVNVCAVEPVGAT